MNTYDLVNKVLEEGAARAADAVRGAFEHGSEKLESPIEKLFLAQILHPEWGFTYQTTVEVLVPPSGLLAHANPPPWPGLFVWPQISIGEYRVDFLVGSTLYGQTKTVIVECDGHDFHEKTKQQAQRDKARDRFLISCGYHVLRYTGSEIHRDSHSVVDEVLRILTDQPA